MSSPWRALAELVGDLLRLRRGPQDVPYSPTLLLLALIPYALLSSALAAFAMPASRALLYGPTEAALLAVLVYVSVAVRRRPARYVQTLTALLLVGVVFNALSLPLTALARPENGLGLLILALVAWSFAVSVHILRLALDLPVPGSVLVNLGFFFAAYFGLGYLFGLLS
ncbi:hypothetical protein [Immundisolibacter sp.]|jgi:hypothetical protein|uniref:hypothetical protein n=1 Tax=Immundisolibacter sp. TaxID=1934948 RepID=UPI002B06E211|nr:hypothetical protein [Immundisolibacter sp.]MEA3221119.1 hypothetical protein [Immundisolibacter sp.]